MRKILAMKDANMLRDYVGADVYARLHANRYVSISLPEGAYLIAFHFCDIKDPFQKDDKVCIYMRPDTFLFASDNKKCKHLMAGVDENKDSVSQLFEFFLALTENDVSELGKTEDKITDIEDVLLTRKKTRSDSSSSIIKLRHELLKMKRYYEQLSLIVSDLSENTEEAFSDEMQKRFAALDRRVDYLFHSVLHLREYITQVREAYQAQIDIEQNQIMKIFTVITAIFLPLTLIVGWYGMNLQMPEYGWRFGYPYVIILSVVICVAEVIMFKIKKWF